MRYMIKPETSIDLFKDFDKVIDSFFNKEESFDLQYPAVDIWEEDNRYILEAELPGLTEKDIEVKVMDNLLTVSSSKNMKKNEKRKGLMIKERRDSFFSRSFVMPENADKNKIKAGFKKGILTLKIGKRVESKQKNIKIQVK